MAIEKSRKAAEDAARRVAERNQKIRDLFYEDYVSVGDYVRIKPQFEPPDRTGKYIKHIRPGIYVVIKTGATCDEDKKEVYGCYGQTYDPSKRARVAMCEKVKTESGELVTESDKEKSRHAFYFEELIKCDESGQVLYNDMREWGKVQSKKIHEATGFDNDHTLERYRNQQTTIKKALCIPKAYEKLTRIQQAFGVYL